MLRRHIVQRATVLATALALSAASRAHAQQSLADIRDLTPRELRAEAFTLESAQTVSIEAVGAEPARSYRSGRNNWLFSGDEERTWPAAAWIIDARTRQVVWDLRTVETDRSRDGIRSFSGEARLPAGTYVVWYGSFVATSTTINGDFNVANIRNFLRGAGRRRDVRYSGPYVDDGAYREFRMVVRGQGRHLTGRDEAAAIRPNDDAVLVELIPADTSVGVARYGFVLDRATDVEVRAVGELNRDGTYDYGWIMNADTRARVWEMSFTRSGHAGGAEKNRMARQTVRLEPGRYVAYYAMDDSHGPDDWNAVPPLDPEAWGLTLRVADGAARARIRPFTYEPVPAGQTIVSLTGIGDEELRSEGFTLRSPMEVRIFAIGEGSNPDGEMDDYAWIVNTTTRRRVWTMDYDGTEHAGGADKNRLFDGTVRLEPGSYMVYYKSDGSHSAREWNSAPPAEARYWGVSVFPSSGRLDRSQIGPYERTRATALAELVRIRDDVRARTSFRIERDQTVRVVALGEGDSGEMYDYAWIEEAGTGRVVWEMTYRTSVHAGGARKNRMFDGEVRLNAGSYVLRYETDGSHAYGDWNADPPDDPESWGVTVLPARP